MAAAAQAGLLQQQAELERKAAELEKKERELQSNAASINREYCFLQCPAHNECDARGSLSCLACQDLKKAQPVQVYAAFSEAMCPSCSPSQLRQPFWDSTCHPITDKAGNELRDKMLESSSGGSLPSSMLLPSHLATLSSSNTSFIFISELLCDADTLRLFTESSKAFFSLLIRAKQYVPLTLIFKWLNLDLPSGVGCGGPLAIAGECRLPQRKALKPG